MLPQKLELVSDQHGHACVEALSCKSSVLSKLEFPVGKVNDVLELLSLLLVCQVAPHHCGLPALSDEGSDQPGYVVILDVVAYDVFVVGTLVLSEEVSELLILVLLSRGNLATLGMAPAPRATGAGRRAIASLVLRPILLRAHWV